MTGHDGEGADGGPLEVVRAAGGVVLRDGPDGPEVLAVHRPTHGDWSLPKGKCDPGETWEDAAVREVAEETGYACRLGPEVGEVSYTDRRGRPKRVRYWAMAAEDARDPERPPDDEVDEVRWLPLALAPHVLTYPHDAELARAAVDLVG